MVPSAYVHIPFCNSICAYCDFVRIQKNEQLIDFDIHMISHMISGALNDLSIYLAESDNLNNEQIYKAVDYLLKGFKKNG